MKRCFCLCIVVWLCLPFASAFAMTLLPPDATVAILQFGAQEDIQNRDQVAEAAAEYVLEALQEHSTLTVYDRDLMAQTLAERGLSLTGLQGLEAARKVVPILDTPYVIWGYVSALHVEDNLVGIPPVPIGDYKVGFLMHKKKASAHLALRIMDADTGFTLALTQGDGKCKSGVQVVTVNDSALGGGDEASNAHLIEEALKRAADEATLKALVQLGLQSH